MVTVEKAIISKFQLALSQQYSKLYQSMKATFNIPDDLYREVKARSALEGRPVRDVVIALFRQWLGKKGPEPLAPKTDWTNFDPPLRDLLSDEVTDHSMEAIRESIVAKFDETA